MKKNGNEVRGMLGYENDSIEVEEIEKRITLNSSSEKTIGWIIPKESVKIPSVEYG